MYRTDRLLLAVYVALCPSAPLCTVANSKQYPQLTDIKEQDLACPRRRILLWRTTSCRRVSGRWVQPFRSNIQCWTFESLLGIWHASGYRVPRIARLSDSCSALYSEAFCTRPRESGALPSLQLQIKLRRSRHPVFGDKPSVLAYVFTVQLIGKCDYTVELLQLEGRFYFLRKR